MLNVQKFANSGLSSRYIIIFENKLIIADVLFKISGQIMDYLTNGSEIAGMLFGKNEIITNFSPNSSVAAGFNELK